MYRSEPSSPIYPQWTIRCSKSSRTRNRTSPRWKRRCVPVLLDVGWLEVVLPVVVVEEQQARAGGTGWRWRWSRCRRRRWRRGRAWRWGRGWRRRWAWGRGVVDVPVFVLEVPDDGCAVAEPPAEDEDELPVEAFADEPPEVVDVEPVVLVEALADPPEVWLVGAGECGVPVVDPVVV